MAYDVYCRSFLIAFCAFSLSFITANSAADIFWSALPFKSMDSAMASSTSSTNFKIVNRDFAFSDRKASDICLNSFLRLEILVSFTWMSCRDSSTFRESAWFLTRSFSSIALYSFLRGLRASPDESSVVRVVALDAICWGLAFGGSDRAFLAEA